MKEKNKTLVESQVYIVDTYAKDPDGFVYIALTQELTSSFPVTPPKKKVGMKFF